MNPTKQLAKQIFDNLNHAGAELGNYSELIIEDTITAFEQSTEQVGSIAYNKTQLEIWKEWCEKDISWTDAAYGAMSEYASQQTAYKDRQLQVQQSHIDDQDQLIFEQGKEIEELKEALSELIQVKDWKDKHGKDEHYLKAISIAWENVRKLIQK